MITSMTTRDFYIYQWDAYSIRWVSIGKQQWGAYSTNTTVSFPVAFSSKVFAVVSRVVNRNYDEFCYEVNKLTTESFYGYSNSKDVRWIAIGM